MANNRLLRSSWLWLIIAAILSLFSGGRWAIPLAVWLAPVFLLRFARMQRPLSGYLLVALVRAIAGCLTLQGVIPAPGYVFYPIVVILTFVTSLPYLADRLIASGLRGFASTLIFPAAYTTIEYLGSLGPFGSFSSMANTQYGNLPLMQLASVTGIWGITFLITWFAAVVNWAWEREFVWPRVRAGAMLYGTILAAVLLGGGARLAIFPPQATPVRVVGLSASQAASTAVDQQVPMDTMMAVMSGKGTPAQRALVSAAHAQVADDLLTRSQREARAGAEIIVWPEVAAPVLQEDEPALIQRAAALAKQEGIYLDLGLAVNLTNVHAGAPAAKDESVLIDPTGKVIWTYEKTYLVPFLETGQVVPGNGKVPLVDSPYGRLANVICFDLDFPRLIRQAGQAGADLMLAPANDWREIDPVHTQAAAFRAIENGFSLVRQDSRGLAMVVDYEGHVLAASDYFTTDQQVMVADVPIHGVHTIYAAIGDLFAWLCMVVLLALTGIAILQSRRIGSATTVPSPLPQPTSDTQSKNRRCVMTDRKLLRLSAILMFVGEVVLTYFVQHVHPGGAATNQETFEIYAASTSWAAIHLIEFISTAILLAGLVVLFFALNITEGAPRWLSFFAVISTSAALALVAVLYATDGVALKQSVNAWASAPAAEQATRFASAEAIRWLEWGTNSYQGYMFGLALLLFGTVIAWTARVPRPIGYLMAVSGLAFMVLSWLTGTGGFSSSNAVVIEVAWISLYASTIWILIVAWRLKESIPASVSAQTRKMSTN